MIACKDFIPAIANESITCPVCGSEKYAVLHEAEDYEYELPGIFYVSRCVRCGLIQQNPRPGFSEIVRYYTEKYEPFKSVGSKVMQKVRYRFLVRPRLKKYKDLFRERSGVIKILDVGCAQGDLLQELCVDGRFDCEGVEPVGYASEIARSRGLRVQCTTLEEYQCADETFDLLIMNHVLEHLPDPVRTVNKAFAILKKGGVLSGELPCADALERIIFGKYWGMYHLPRHLIFFSRHLLERFLRQAGFTEVEIYLQPVPSAWQASVRNFLNDKKAPKGIARFFSGHSLPLNLITFPIVFLAAKFGYASIMHFTARK